MTPGCINGFLRDPQEWFYSYIKRNIGDSAMDYKTLMKDIPPGPKPGVFPNYNNSFFGITQQIRSNGEVAGRLFLPTNTPDDNGYYVSYADIFTGSEADGTLKWAPFRFQDGRYIPGPCDVNGPVDPPPNGNIEEKVNLILVKMNEFDSRLQQVEKTIASLNSVINDNNLRLINLDSYLKSQLNEIQRKQDRSYRGLGITFSPKD